MNILFLYSGVFNVVDLLVLPSCPSIDFLVRLILKSSYWWVEGQSERSISNNMLLAINLQSS